jgi:hypothetical protein
MIILETAPESSSDELLLELSSDLSLGFSGSSDFRLDESLSELESLLSCLSLSELLSCKGLRLLGYYGF